MGVYINMEMPKPKSADMETIYNAYILVDPNGRAAIVVDNEDGLDSTEYPLVPIPPHGRLIDADKIGLTDFEIILCQKGNPFKNALEMLLEKIENAPTIIPANAGE